MSKGQKPNLPTKKQMDDYRKKHFAVYIEPSRDSDGYHTMCVTFNGVQGQNIAFNISELKKLNETIAYYLGRHSNESEKS